MIQNRRIYDWLNGPDRLMTMLANGNLGLALNTPGNRLEINSDFYGAAGTPLLVPVTDITANGHPQVPGLAPPTGFSGLRFSDLTSASIPEMNDSSVVLSIDLNGDVILVPTVPQEQIAFLEARIANLEEALSLLMAQR